MVRTGAIEARVLARSGLGLVCLARSVIMGAACEPRELLERAEIARAHPFAPRTPAAAPHPSSQAPSGCALFEGEKRSLCEEGRSHFFNAELSPDGAVSCATCHPSTAVQEARSAPVRFADGRPRPFARGRPLNGPRTPSLLDVGRTQGPFFWNGRARMLSAQPFWPLYAMDELAATPSHLQAHGGSGRIALALTAYMHSLQSGPAAFDRWMAGECGALSESEIRGARLVLREKKCAACHTGTELRGTRTEALAYPTLPAYALVAREISYSADAELAQSGSRNGTRVLRSVPPTLRNLIHRTRTYGRYGQHDSLEEFLESHGLQPVDPTLRNPLGQEERKDIVSFLLIGLRSDQLPE